MASIKVEDVVEQFSFEMRHALEDAVKEAIPEATFDSNVLFRAFQRAVGRRCSNWQRVPPNCVKT
jgi:hypothetical protein